MIALERFAIAAATPTTLAAALAARMATETKVDRGAGLIGAALVAEGLMAARLG